MRDGECLLGFILEAQRSMAMKIHTGEWVSNPTHDCSTRTGRGPQGRRVDHWSDGPRVGGMTARISGAARE
jgi:hypothetical protein